MLILWVSGSLGQVYGFELTLRHDVQNPWISDFNRLDTFAININLGFCHFIDIISDFNKRMQRMPTHFWYIILSWKIIRNWKKKLKLCFPIESNATGKILRTTEKKGKV